jgi:hypothetical protein
MISPLIAATSIRKIPDRTLPNQHITEIYSFAGTSVEVGAVSRHSRDLFANLLTV